MEQKNPPLVLEEKGSFFIGGERVERTAVELGNPAFGPGHIVINQMYVEYMVPATHDRRIPVIMVHGGTLSGQTWTTTPDGRMGWDQYFVQRGHPVYVIDQVARGRSGFDPAAFNNVREGLAERACQPTVFRSSEELTWKAWRLGPSYGIPFEDTQFPIEAAGELSKYNVADLNSMFPPPDPNPTCEALSRLALRLGGAVLMGHSQGGALPLHASWMNPEGVKGLVLVEGGATLKSLSDEQLSILCTFPILHIYGDHLDAESGVPGFNRRALFNDCLELIAKINAGGGNSKMLYPPDMGIFGNSHMMMFDRNNKEIADLIIDWIETNVSI